MKNNYLFLILAFFLILHQQVYCQNLAYFQAQFNKGKDKFKAADYTSCMDLFLAASVDNIENPYAKTSCFYFAISAFKTNKLSESKSMLHQIQLKYDDWNKDEVNYLLGNIYFEQKEFDKALATLNKIEDLKLRADIRAMKIFYFSKFKDPAFLKPIYLRNPKEIEVAEILKFKLKDSNIEADKKIVADIVKLVTNSIQVPKDTSFIKKAKYKVAILLPFKLLSISVRNDNSDNRFVYDFMQGIRIALDSLDSARNVIDLYLYDCDKDTNKLLKVLNLPELAGMDVIIGPIYQNLSTASSSFALAQGIPTINPFSVVSRVLKPNNFYFFFKPSIESQAKVAASYMVSNLKPLKAMIFYGKNARDSISANICKSTLETGSVKVVSFKTVDRNSSIGIGRFLERKIIDSLGAIFVFSGEQLVATNLVTSLAQVNSQVPLFVPSDWMNFESFTYDQYQKHNIHFILPTLETQNDTIKAYFKTTYLEKYNIVPNEYVYLGVDLMQWVGRNLLERGKIDYDFVAKSGYQSGVLTTGIDFSNSMDNQVVPIVKFEDFILKRMNR